MPIRVLIAEDSLLVREGLTKLLDADPTIEVVGTCGDYAELIDQATTTAPDVVVTDIRMPPTGTDEGIRAANELRDRRPELGVVVLSQYAETSYALALLGDGTEGRAYLLKERVGEVEQLVAAITAVATGGSVVDPKVVEALLDARARDRESPLRYLTPREREVLESIAQGLNNASVAASLHLSERAVEKHINSLFSKLGLSEEPNVHRRVKAVLLFLDGTR